MLSQWGVPLIGPTRWMVAGRGLWVGGVCVCVCVRGYLLAHSVEQNLLEKTVKCYKMHTTPHTHHFVSQSVTSLSFVFLNVLVCLCISVCD